MRGAGSGSVAARGGRPSLRDTYIVARVLYLSYDGMTDPLGESQVIPYLEGLARYGHEIHLVSFEKQERYAKGRDRIARMLAGCSIRWHPLSYTKRPPVLSTVWDVARLRRRALALHRRHGFDLVHCRSYIPAIAGLELKRRHGVRFLFDMRGFWPDEKVDAGAWRLDRPLYRAVYRYFKRLEREALRDADGIVVLSEAGKREMAGRGGMRSVRAPTLVIPCSVDFSRFDIPPPQERGAMRVSLGIPADALVLTYLGSLGTWYLLDEMLDLFLAVRSARPGTRFLFVTPDDPRAVLRPAAERGIDPGDIVIRSATREEVPGYLAAADIGISFIRPSPSKVASSPTKLGEFLAVGIPVITNGGVGDVARIVEDARAGILVSEFSPAGYGSAVAEIDRLLGLERPRIRERARQVYDIDLAIASFAALYERMLGDPIEECLPRE
jgi:glycosyltransferase involved in cell wall biosynthesis